METLDYYSAEPVEMPVSIAELGVPGLRSSATPTTFSTPCRDDLVTIDGRPVAVRVSGDVKAAMDREGLTLEACGAPLDLGRGDHEIRTAAGRTAGIEIDRLVLDSPAGGSVAPSASRPPVRIPATAQVVGTTRTSFDVRVDVSDARPFWLVLAQSHNDGWAATLGGRSLGPPQLVDGFANGWLITPDQMGTFDVQLRWTPQRVVWVALALSALAILACLAIVIATGRRLSGSRSAAATVAQMPTLDLWRSAKDSPAPHSAPRALHVAWVLAVALFFGAAAAPVVGALAGVAAAVSLAWPPARRLLRFGAAAALCLGAAYVIVQQARYSYPPDFAWPQNFPRAHTLGWLAVALLAADLVQPSRRRGRSEDHVATAESGRP